MWIGDWNGIAPTVNFASRAATTHKTHWGPRLIPDCQLVYVASGRARLALGGERFEAGPGDFLFYGPDCPHMLTADEGTDYFSLHFSWNASSPLPVHPAPRIREDVTMDEARPAAAYALLADGYGEVAVPHRFAAHGLEPLLMRIVSEYRHERPGFPVMLRALLAELLCSVVRQLAERNARGTKQSRIGPAIDAMREEPGRNWSVAELAGLCGYNPSYFTDVFRQEIGKNPKAYLIAERVRQTKQGLLRGEKLETLAETFGYASVHYLSRQFKKATGLTPGQFRQQGTHADM
ncbi:AraC family transcriptional regulator [Paenibacillus sp. GYB003]|uniref:AraC family transcriptional regulator n=1 Tax=Paenibacillus sp. GYB003 TaxID=2994392 RepID=UPI002F9635BE